MTAAVRRSWFFVPDETWRVLAVRGRDAILVRGTRVSFGRRYVARGVAVTLYLAMLLMGGVGFGIEMGGAGVVIGVLFGALGVLPLVFAHLELAPRHFFEACFTIDTRSGVLLDGRDALVAAAQDFRLQAIGPDARDGFEIAWESESHRLMAAPGDDLAGPLAELRRLGLVIAGSGDPYRDAR